MLRDAAKLIRRKLDRLRGHDYRSEQSEVVRHGICQDLIKSTGLFRGLNQACLPLFANGILARTEYLSKVPNIL